MVWQAGQSLDRNRYTIQKKLGSGGFGVTYLVKDGKGREWVVKTLKDEVMNSEEHADYRDKYLRDFQAETLRLAICRHRHIVQIENSFTHENFPCILMEYVQGIDLWQRLKKQGVLAEAEAVRYIRQIGEALTVVHDKGLLHRDLKPHNIMVRPKQDEAVLIDFGIAKEFIPDVTQTHSIALTPGFAPIEQYDEQAHRGEFTDVYALAATLATLVTGSPPPPSFMRTARDRFQVPTGVSGAMQEAIKQGMAVYPEDRTQTVEAWLELLQVKPPKVQVPARYRQLEALLAAGKWQEADEETAKVMLEVTNRTKEGLLRLEDIDNFPCEDLRAIDGLWVKYSNGRFGFSLQKRIYQSLGGTREYNRQAWNNFGDRVGWRKGGSWLYYKDITFNNKAPEGHLPTPPFERSVGVVCGVGWMWGCLFSRVETCRM